MTRTSKRILVFTGDGKGKTTAALGMVLRAVGHRHRCAIIQFVKADSSSGEVEAIKHLPGVYLEQTGLGFLPQPEHPNFAKHKARARAGLKRVADVLAQDRPDVVVLDEVCVAIMRDLLSEASVLEVMSAAPAHTCLVLTGRGATPGLLAAADTVTEMQPVCHAMQHGRGAEEGVEW